MRKNKLIVILIVTLAVIIPSGAAAQEQGFGGEQPSTPESIDDEELDKFFAALSNIYEVQDKFQKKLETVFEESSLTEERFNEIDRLKSGSSENPDSVSNSENRQYNEILNAIEELNELFQEEMVEIIQDEGLTLENFQMIANYVNQNPELMQERMN